MEISIIYETILLETNQKTTYSLAFHDNQSIIFKKERIFTM